MDIFVLQTTVTTPGTVASHTCTATNYRQHQFVAFFVSFKIRDVFETLDG
jgi:hypothetical protein